MTRRIWDYSGYTTGQNITSSNHAALDAALSTVSPGTGGTTAIDVTHTITPSSKSLKQTNGTTAVGVVRYTLATPSAVGAYRDFFYCEDFPAATRVPLMLRSAAGQVAHVTSSTSDGSLRWLRGNNATSGAGVALGTASAAAALDDDLWIRREVTWDLASGANCDLTVRYYTAGTNGTGTTLRGECVLASADLFAAGGDYAISSIETGAKSQDASLPVWLAYGTTDDSAAVEIGALAAGSPTVIGSLPVPSVIDARSSVAGGTGSLSYSISQDSGPTATPVLLTAGLWAIERQATDTVWTVTVTETPGSATDTDTFTIDALPNTGSGGIEIQVYTGAAFE